MAHAGSQPHGSVRLRILLTLCELQLGGAPATYRDLQERLEMSPGAVSWHIGKLDAEGLVARSGQARALSLTAQCLGMLVSDGWLAPAHSITFSLSTAALELLERAPGGEETLEDGQP